MQRDKRFKILLRAAIPGHAFFTYVPNVGLKSKLFIYYLLEVTYETILLSMDIALGKSLDLLFKLYVDPMSINFFKGVIGAY